MTRSNACEAIVAASIRGLARELADFALYNGLYTHGSSARQLNTAAIPGGSTSPGYYAVEVQRSAQGLSNFVNSGGYE